MEVECRESGTADQINGNGAVYYTVSIVANRKYGTYARKTTKEGKRRASTLSSEEQRMHRIPAVEEGQPTQHLNRFVIVSIQKLKR